MANEAELKDFLNQIWIKFLYLVPKNMELEMLDTHCTYISLKASTGHNIDFVVMIWAGAKLRFTWQVTCLQMFLLYRLSVMFIRPCLLMAVERLIRQHSVAGERRVSPPCPWLESHMQSPPTARAPLWNLKIRAPPPSTGGEFKKGKKQHTFST